MNWYKIASRTVKEHIRDVIKADLDSPLFVTETYEIIDGAHRSAKASILGKNVEIIILTQDDLNKALLPEDSDYVGQIYRDDDKNEYSITKLIELYGNRPTETADPNMILDNSENVWGSKVDIYDIMEEAKKELLKEAKLNGWYKTAGKEGGYIVKDYPYTSAPILLQEIERQGEKGLSLATMTRDELDLARDLEKANRVKRIVNKDSKGEYLSYIAV